MQRYTKTNLTSPQAHFTTQVKKKTTTYSTSISYTIDVITHAFFTHHSRPFKKRAISTYCGVPL